MIQDNFHINFWSGAKLDADGIIFSDPGPPLLQIILIATDPNLNMSQSCESAKVQFCRSAIAYPQILLFRTSAFDSYIFNISELRTKTAYTLRSVW